MVYRHERKSNGHAHWWEQGDLLGGVVLYYYSGVVLYYNYSVTRPKADDGELLLHAIWHSSLCPQVENDRIGDLSTYQRHYYSQKRSNCSPASALGLV